MADTIQVTPQMLRSTANESNEGEGGARGRGYPTAVGRSGDGACRRAAWT